ncbi:MAG TPA: hypothetical protein VF707_05595 [Ardenticatenaceae bacterium]|jgi:hypothetical protein
MSTNEAMIEQSWFLKSRVQESIVGYLQAQGYAIISASDGGDGDGQDIVAENAAGPLWLAVIGFPPEQLEVAETQHALAGKWFTDTLLRVLTWKAEIDTSGAKVAVALPDVQRYRKLARDTKWMRNMVRFNLLWVREDGKVDAQPRLK